jgi:MerR family transcriptional regulator, copper efflux regulator
VRHSPVHHSPDFSSPEPTATTYLIGEVAERMGLSLRTVRYYEEAGLVLPQGRTPGNFRVYGDDALQRLGLIKHMKPLGFSLEEMRDLLELRDRLSRGRLDPEEAAALRGRLALYAEAARQRYVALQEQVSVAEAFVRQLDRDVRRYGYG